MTALMGTVHGEGELLSGPSTTEKKYRPRYVDIGINLTDAVYTGSYHGRTHHPSDLPSVISRAQSVSCQKLLITGSDVKESRKAIELARSYPGVCYTTIGVHPCSCLQFTEHDGRGRQNEDSGSSFLQELKDVALAAKKEGIAVAFGEIGLDYDRLTLCPKEVQLEFFEKQLEVAADVDLPLFLHSRAAHRDFLEILGKFEGRLTRKGVVHSFTGTKEEMLELVDKGWDIGVNGCSLKTEENCDVVKAIPLERLHLETDGPWCEIRASHAGAAVLQRLIKEKRVTEEEVDGDGTEKWKGVKKEKWVEGVLVKGRNEPCLITKVAWAVAGIKDVGIEVVTEAAWSNSVRMFGLGVDEGGSIGSDSSERAGLEL